MSETITTILTTAITITTDHFAFEIGSIIDATLETTVTSVPTWFHGSQEATFALVILKDATATTTNTILLDENSIGHIIFFFEDVTPTITIPSVSSIFSGVTETSIPPTNTITSSFTTQIQSSVMAPQPTGESTPSPTVTLSLSHGTLFKASKAVRSSPSSPTSSISCSPDPSSTTGPRSNSCSPRTSPVAGLVALGVSLAVFLLISGLVIYYRFIKRGQLGNAQKLSHLEGGPLMSGDVRTSKHAFNITRTNTDHPTSTRKDPSSLKLSHFSRLTSPQAQDLPLDDKALSKLFTDLDNRIIDHVVNYWRSGDITSPEYQTYINSPRSRNSWANVLYQGRPLLANISSRIPVFRAILAYHVYTAIVDWRVLTTEQQAKVQDEGVAIRRTLCRNLERSEPDTRKRINVIYNLLERETRIHVSEEMREDKLYRQSLEELATVTVVLSLKLGTQADGFKFDFREKDNESAVVSDSLVVKFLGEAVDMQKMEVVNEMDGTVRALISPGVTRVSRNIESVVRLAQVYTA
ncbi:hypothetical protein AA313_de0202112 [Arthrobotrys entomopaga]|nr:hypothetical protein AA313_de0202112 [Arthrobotrys entomopaga]